MGAAAAGVAGGAVATEGDGMGSEFVGGFVGGFGTLTGGVSDFTGGLADGLAGGLSGVNAESLGLPQSMELPAAINPFGRDLFGKP